MSPIGISRVIDGLVRTGTGIVHMLAADEGTATGTKVVRRAVVTTECALTHFNFSFQNVNGSAREASAVSAMRFNKSGQLFGVR